MKFLLAAVVSVAMLAATVPAQADNSEEVIIGIIGGALGGLIVGEVIGGNRDRHRHDHRVYVYEEPYYEPYCYVKKVRYYDHYRDVYVVKKKRICE